MNNLCVRPATFAGLIELIQILSPARLVVGTQIIEIVPAVDARIVPIIKSDLQGVVAGFLQGTEQHLPLAVLQYLIAPAMASHLGAGREHALD